MKVWQKDRKSDFGVTLLEWRHRAVGRFIMKIGSWLLGAFVMGLLAAIALHAIGQDAIAQNGARIAFVVVFIIGVLSAFYRHIYYGLHYQIREKALVSVRPICGFETLISRTSQVDKAFGTKLEYLPWSQIKDVKEEKGNLLLLIKDYQDPLKIGVAPVRALQSSVSEEKSGPRLNSGGIFGKDINLDKEAIRLIIQKIREAKKSAGGK
ncbi:hypothetical protein JXO59_03965 [candidate division KSB1 bacterium]|nr:hypothetical protein [candidate division KSB1 bacterium]